MDHLFLMGLFGWLVLFLFCYGCLMAVVAWTDHTLPIDEREDDDPEMYYNSMLR